MSAEARGIEVAMSIMVRELRAVDDEHALTLWKRAGNAATCAIDPSGSAQTRIKPVRALSLVAVEAGEVRGVIVCHAQSTGKLCYQLAADVDDVRRLLLDKALFKLHARGWHTCGIEPSQDTAGPQLWDMMKCAFDTSTTPAAQLGHVVRWPRSGIDVTRRPTPPAACEPGNTEQIPTSAA